MDINASTASQAYATAKPPAEGTKGTTQSGPASQKSPSSQNNAAAATNPAVTLDLSPHVLKVEAFADLSAQDRQELVRIKQEVLDHWTEIARSHGNEPDFSSLEGKNINFSWSDGTIKTWRADGYVVTSRYDAPQEQELQRQLAATVAADRAGTDQHGMTVVNDTAAPATPATPPPPAEHAAPAATPPQDAAATVPPQTKASDEGIKLSDLPPEEQQKWLRWREGMRNKLAQRGETLQGNIMCLGPNNEIMTLTADDRILTRQQDMRYAPTEESLARRRAADEQKRREAEAAMAAQTEWEKKWGVGIKVSDPEKMTATELNAAREVAGIEQALRLLRDDMSFATGADWTIKQYSAEIEKLSSSPTDRSKEIADLQQRINGTKARREALIKKIYDRQNWIGTAYGFKVEGNLVNEDANGRFREGTYTLTKEGGGWALKVDSAEGIMLSVGGGAFTREFKRMARAETGASPIQTETREERTRRVQSTVPQATTESATPAKSPASTAQALPFDSSRYRNLPGFSESKLSDLSAEEQQSLLKLREYTKAMYASWGETFGGTTGRSTASGLETILTADDRVITYQRNMSSALTPEQTAQQKADDEQRQKEIAASKAEQEAWRTIWAKDAEVWRGRMTADESAVAESVASAEAVLVGVRDDLSSMFGLHASIQRNTEKLNAQGEGTNSDMATSLKKEIAAAQAKFAGLLSSIQEAQDRLRNKYGYQITGNLVDKLADGNYREGRYTLTKASEKPGEWAIRVNSEEGVSVSFKNQPFTRDFKRMIVYGPGPALVNLNKIPLATDA